MSKVVGSIAKFIILFAYTAMCVAVVKGAFLLFSLILDGVSEIIKTKRETDILIKKSIDDTIKRLDTEIENEKAEKSTKEFRERVMSCREILLNETMAHDEKMSRIDEILKPV
jgi:hypothetical protein